MTQLNSYHKYCPNVFVAKCSEEHAKGEVITITTKYGKENEHIIHNLVGKSNGFFYYSITRADGYNSQVRAQNKADKYNSWAESATNQSNAKWEASNEGRDFLVLGEPIKIGHHSEKRHRALIQRNWDRMDKAMELKDKAEKHAYKADYWADKAEEINLSMPESIDFFEAKLEKAKELQCGLKNGTIERSHSFSLTYATKAVKDLESKVKIAKLLWS